eukprot:scaffold119056_cov63-Phaeocystis_antarctica.AAC.2
MPKKRLSNNSACCRKPPCRIRCTTSGDTDATRSGSLQREVGTSPTTPCPLALMRHSRSDEETPAGSSRLEPTMHEGWSDAAVSAANCRAVGWSKTSVLGSAGAPSPSACCSCSRSSIAPSESSPASNSGASASTAYFTSRATSASTVSSETTFVGEGAAKLCVAAAASTDAPPTPPASSCADIDEPIIPLKAVTAESHHPTLCTVEEVSAVTPARTAEGYCSAVS